MRKVILSLLVALSIALTATAQDRVITGKVIDDKGAGLSGVSVVPNVGGGGTKTDGSGSFSIKVSSAAKSLSFSEVGFESKVVSLTSSSILNVALIQTNSTLDDVIIVGYGAAKKKADVVGSATKVDAKQLQDRPSANVIDALQGRVAGVQIYTSTGEPSASSSIRINGVGSLTASATPLYVLDGIPLGQGSIVSLNPNDFESVTVLRDPSSTAIYGSRAANGVIMLTSKKGSTRKPVVTLKTQYAQSNLIGTADKFNSTVFDTEGLYAHWLDIGFRTQPQIDALRISNPFDTKWKDVYYKSNVPASQIDLSVSGGAGKTSYFVSGAYFKSEGLAYRSTFKRYTFRANIQSAVNDYVTIGANMSGGVDNRQLNPYGSNSTNRGLAFLAQPFYSPINPTTGAEYDLIPGWGRYHPNYLSQKIQSTGENLQFNPQGFVQVKPFKNFILKSAAGIDGYEYVTSNVQLPSFIGSLNNGNASEDYERQIYKTITNTAEYSFKVKGDNSINLLAGQEFVKSVTKTFFASSAGQTDDRLTLVSAGPNNRNAGSGNTTFSYLSYFGRISYDYSKRYYLDLTARQDESSRFGKDNRKAKFWSVGTRWNVTKEAFMQNVNWISDLSLKASIGTSGNSAIGNFDNQALVATGQYDAASTFFVSTPGNPNLGWEKALQKNITLNATIKNRLNLEVEYYDKLTTNQLLNVPLPITSGFTSVQTNVGGVSNKGWNVTFDADVISTKKAKLTPYFNFNYNNQKVTELFDGRQFYSIPNTGVTWAVGQAVSYYYPIFKGINTTTGNPEWYQPNSDPNKVTTTQTDDTKVTSTFNATTLLQNTGIKRYAPFAGGFGLSGSYTGFFINADFSFVSGKYLINNDRFFSENPYQFTGFNQSPVVNDYWKQAGDVARFPRKGVQFTQFDSRLIEDASFIRLKNFTVGYNLPNDLLSRTKAIKGARLYVTGRNLLTFTKYNGPDPEIDTNVTLGANPNTRQVAVGLDLTF